MYDVFYLSSYSDFFFLSNLFDYWFPYCIHLYIWSTQQVTVAQHMCWFFIKNEMEQFWHLNHVLILNWIIWNGTVLVCKTELFEMELF